MNDSSQARSPVHARLEARQPTWSRGGSGPFAVHFEAEEVERAHMQTLGLCDVSLLAKLGIRGRDAAAWLAQQGIDVPAEIYHARPLDIDGIIARVGCEEFFLEDGPGGAAVPPLAERLPSAGNQVFAVERQEATFLLVGSQALDVLAQTCGVDLRRAAPEQLVMTRVAGASCGVFPQPIGDLAAFRLWIDPSYAVYLWETLVEICTELEGGVIGAGCFYPELE